MYDMLIKNGTIVSSKQSRKMDIAVQNGKIVSLKEHLDEQAARIIDASDKYILPGVIEAHMHAYAPFQGCLGANDFYEMSISAAFGGVTTFMDFAMTQKTGTLQEAIDKRKQEMSISAIDYSFHGKIVDKNQCQEIPKMAEQGIPTFKMFMTYKKDGVMVDDETMLEAFILAKENKCMPMMHCESDPIAAFNQTRSLALGNLTWRQFAKDKPIICEAEAFSRAVYFGKYAGCGMIIVHTTNGEALDIARKFRRKGMPLYVETCPHYLTLFDNIYDTSDGHLAICSPPLRTPKERDELWEGMADGTITLTGSDDCTYTYEEKSMFLQRDTKGNLIQDYTKVVNGLSGIEIRLPILLSEGVSKGRISLEQAVALTSENIARVYGCFPQKGIIAEGSDADIVLVDMERENVISAKKLHNNIDYCLHEGMKVKGVPYMTISHGKILVENGHFYGEKSGGHFLKRKISDVVLTEGLN